MRVRASGTRLMLEVHNTTVINLMLEVHYTTVHMYLAFADPVFIDACAVIAKIT